MMITNEHDGERAADDPDAQLGEVLGERHHVVGVFIGGRCRRRRKAGLMTSVFVVGGRSADRSHRRASG